MIILYLLLLIFAAIVLRIVLLLPKKMLLDVIQFKIVTADDIAFGVLFWLSSGTIIWMLVDIIKYIF